MVYNTENGASLQFRNQPTRKKIEEKDSGYCCWKLRKKKEILFRNYLSRFARALSTIRAGRASSRRRNVYEETAKNQTYLEIRNTGTIPK